MGKYIEKTDTKFTYKDYCGWSEERWELIDGKAFKMTPAPSKNHQDTLRELFLKIGNFLIGKPCVLYSSPFDVRLFDTKWQSDESITTVVQPDIVVICDHSKLDEKGCRGAPDLVIEITSPESIVRDEKIKLSLYEKHTVKEYWIVNPTDKTISVYTINNKHYNKPLVYKNKDIVKSDFLKGIKIVVENIFEIKLSE